MDDQQTIDAYLRKARENTSSRRGRPLSARIAGGHKVLPYSACFQAAIAALLMAGIGPRDPSGQWGHGYVQAAFNGQLVKRRKLYPGNLGGVLTNHYDLRQAADYSPNAVTQKRADRALRRSQGFVRAIRRQGEST